MVDIDVGKISESLNDKADRDLNNRTANIHYVVETSSKDILPSWYRVYSDGWCEQGGVNTTIKSSNGIIGLLKPYINTDYHTYISVYRNTNNAYCPSFYEKTVNNFKLYGVADCEYSWQASGYIR